MEKLNMSVSDVFSKAGKGKIKLPTKKTLNMALVDRRHVSGSTKTLLTLLILLGAAAFVMYGVVAPMQKLTDAKNEYEHTYSESQELLVSSSMYNDVLNKYRRYSMDWLETSSAYVSVDREEVLDLIYDVAMARGKVESVSISGELVNVTMSGMTLKEASDMFEVLLEADFVGGVRLISAAASDDGTDEMPANFNFEITLMSPDAEPAAAEEEVQE